MCTNEDSTMTFMMAYFVATWLKILVSLKIATLLCWVFFIDDFESYHDKRNNHYTLIHYLNYNLEPTVRYVFYVFLLKTRKWYNVNAYTDTRISIPSSKLLFIIPLAKSKILTPILESSSPKLIISHTMAFASIFLMVSLKRLKCKLFLPLVIWWQ